MFAIGLAPEIKLMMMIQSIPQYLFTLPGFVDVQYTLTFFLVAMYCMCIRRLMVRNEIYRFALFCVASAVP